MKISRVEVLCANRAVYAKVYTDNGLYGIGESGAWGLLAASSEAIKMFGAESAGIKCGSTTTLPDVLKKS